MARSASLVRIVNNALIPTGSIGGRQVKGTGFYFDSSSYLKYGWIQLNGTWYYLDTKSGAMQTGWLLNNCSSYYNFHITNDNPCENITRRNTKYDG
ncbi:hypothetical protein [Bacillus salipaludis]|uniref:Cell wall-binding protein n=1 Tax=Bacillus salipaludis TaxID=2547811 RepID=A0ABW8RGC5_9BACI